MAENTCKIPIVTFFTTRAVIARYGPVSVDPSVRLSVRP